MKTTSEIPLGLRPKWIILQQRLNEINEAIVRYMDAGYKVPAEWIIERNEIIDYLEERENKEE